MSVLNWQAGDSFDISNVLCSLLIGVGYDAYVVAGYAPKSVTTNDQSRTTCPVLEAEAAAETEEAKKAGESKGNASASKYRVKQATVLESKFVKDMAEETRVRAAEEVAKQKQMEEDEMNAINAHINGPDESEVDEMEGKRVHAWVLVLAGKREVRVPSTYFLLSPHQLKSCVCPSPRLRLPKRLIY
jgi:hypothetical protein